MLERKQGNEEMMGFLTFNANYYENKLRKFENKSLTKDDLYEIKQLLKVLDDLADEGYVSLNTYLENEFSCLTRLRALLKAHGETPFLIHKNRLQETNYCEKEEELKGCIEALTQKVRKEEKSSKHSFLQDILEYSKWIEYEEKTATIFLFRDAFLPYLYFSQKRRKNLYPWLISRRFLEDVSQVKEIDDDL